MYLGIGMHLFLSIGACVFQNRRSASCRISRSANFFLILETLTFWATSFVRGKKRACQNLLGSS